MRQLGYAQAALRQKVLRPFGIDFLERLRGNDSQLGRERPAPHFFPFHDAAQNSVRAERCADRPSASIAFNWR